MSTVTPTPAEAQHRLAVAEGLLLSLGSGPRSLEAAQKFLGSKTLTLAEARDGLEVIIVEARSVCSGCGGKLGEDGCESCKDASAVKDADIPVTGHEPAKESYIAFGSVGLGLMHAAPGDRPAEGDLPKDVDKGRRKKRKRKAREDAITKLLEDSTTGATAAAAVVGEIAAGEHGPVDAATGGPPNLRAGAPAEECANCVFFNKNVCTQYSNYPVERTLVCDGWRTVSPPGELERTSNYKDMTEAWSDAARSASAVARKQGFAMGLQKGDRFHLDGEEHEVTHAVVGASKPLTAKKLSTGESVSVDKGTVVEFHPKTRLAEGLAALLEVKSDAYPGLDRSAKENWVDKVGGLPRYIERIAKHIHYEHGKDIGRSIQIAVGVAQRWCKGGGASAHGVKGGGGVSAATKAKACAAVAEWDAKRAQSKAQTAAKKVSESVELVEAHGFWALSIGEAVGLVESAEWEDARDGGTGFKEPSLAYCERIVTAIEESYSDWDRWAGGFSPDAMTALAEGRLELLPGTTCDIDEAFFKSTLHPRNRRTGEFADVLGKLKVKRPRTARIIDSIGSKPSVASEVKRPAPAPEVDHLEKQRLAHGHEFAPTLEDHFAKKQQSAGGGGHDFSVDQAIGEVIGKFPNVKDWSLDGPHESTAHGKHWKLHVKLGDGQEHHIRVGADGKVDYLKPETPKKSGVTFGAKPTGEGVSIHDLEPTGMTEEPYHMEDGQFFVGKDDHVYEKLEHGGHLMTSKSGQPLAGVKIKNHDTGTTKLVPAFSVKNQYPLYQKKGSAPLAPAKPVKSNDELMGELMDSVKGGGSGDVDLAGKNVVITGTIPGLSRTQAHAILMTHGATPHSSVSSSTHYLITGNGVGKVKTSKAEAMGVKVIPFSQIPHLVVESEAPKLTGKALRLQETLDALEEATGPLLARLRARRDVLASQLARQIEERDFTHAQRMALAAEGKALPDGSYPIEDEEDLHNAEVLSASGHGDAAAAKALIVKRRAALGVKGV